MEAEGAEPAQRGRANKRMRDTILSMVNNSECIETGHAEDEGSSKYSVLLTEYRESHLDSPWWSWVRQAGRPWNWLRPRLPSTFSRGQQVGVRYGRYLPNAKGTWQP